MANPDPQTMIDALTETYTALAANAAASRTAFGRSQLNVQMADVRKEIEYWEDRRDKVARSGRTFIQGRPVR